MTDIHSELARVYGKAKAEAIEKQAKQLNRCQALCEDHFTHGRSRCSRPAKYEVDGHYLCKQHRDIANRKKEKQNEIHPESSQER